MRSRERFRTLVEEELGEEEGEEKGSVCWCEVRDRSSVLVSLRSWANGGRGGRESWNEVREFGKVEDGDKEEEEGELQLGRIGYEKAKAGA